LINEQRQAETRETEAMAVLSNSVRESQEKERAQAERTKYWTIIGLMVGLLTHWNMHLSWLRNLT
jgi:hypothetical protein